MADSGQVGRYIAMKLAVTFSAEMGVKIFSELMSNNENRAQLCALMLETSDRFDSPLAVIRKKCAAQLWLARNKIKSIRYDEEKSCVSTQKSNRKLTGTSADKQSKTNTADDGKPNKILNKKIYQKQAWKKQEK